MGYVKWAGIALAGAVAAGMGALLLIPRWVDLAPYRAAVETALTQATGRPARVSELRLSLLPWAGVEIRGLALASPAGFIEPDVATVPSAELRMRLLPLLRREVHLERVVLHEPHLLLEIAADGRRNWAFAPGRHAERAQTSLRTRREHEAERVSRHRQVVCGELQDAGARRHRSL